MPFNSIWDDLCMNFKIKNNDFGAIEVFAGETCQCILSRHAGRRLLYSEVNTMLRISPLQPRCECTFKHFTDRRHKVERRNFTITNSILNNNRRLQPCGRRKADIHNHVRVSNSYLHSELNAISI